jgi:hypothetical protein
MLARARAWVQERPWVGEVPWVLAATWVAAALLVSQPRLDWPAGSDWHQYVSATWYFWDRAKASVYPDWRNPLYPFLIGVLGQGSSWALAGQVVARVSIVTLVGATALLGRALGGRACAVACAYAAWRFSLLGLAIHWVNHYPMLAAVTALAFAGGALATRYGHPAAALLAGLGGGLALATDARGVAPFLAAVGLVVLALPGRPWRRALWLLVALGCGLAVPLLWDHWVRVAFHVPVIPLTRQIEAQRAAMTSQLDMHVLSDPAVVAACPSPLPSRLDLAALRTPCADALYAFNLRGLTTMGVLPGVTTLAVGVAALLPWRPGGLRGSLASLAVFGGSAAAITVGMRWVWYADRYALQYAAPALVLVPVALARIAGLAPRWRGIAAVIAAAGAARLAAVEWPASTSQRALSIGLQTEAERGRMIAWAGRHVTEGDTVYDCALVDAYLAYAPRRMDYQGLRPELPECPEREAAPPADHHGWLFVTAGASGPGTVPPPDPAVLAAAGWRPVESPSHGYAIWEAGPSAGAEP